MTAAEILRAHAKSAVTLLAELASEEERDRLLALAHAWLENAEKLERQQNRTQRDFQMTRQNRRTEAGHSAALRQ
ncbi:MAG: hypothetical protein JOY67_16270 [Hyphomicrobiales bacterium]|nr:hypothetical protein [Hyphomicrobiales bacterium]MBV9516797.1 hypothetical protein [Hyphomicrobiales bacterium]